ncbi:MAG: plasmid replication protein, CyRepA1 family, partial [Xenococcaceae cyanobacterium]
MQDKEHRQFDAGDHPSFFQQQILDYYRQYNFNPGEWFVLRAAGDKSQKIYIGQIGQNWQDITLYTTKWHSERKRKGRSSVQVYQAAKQISNSVEALRDIASNPEVNAINSYPNHLNVFPKGELLLTDLGNDNASRFDTLFWEIDDLPLAEQTKKRLWLKNELGLDTAISVFSGNKSEHNAISLIVPISLKAWHRLNRKLTVLLRGDVNICNAARAMRLPGVPRVKDGKITEVEITYQSDAKYTPKELEAKLNATGLFPHGLTDIHWSKIVSIHRNKNKSADERWLQVEQILQLSEAELRPKPIVLPRLPEVSYSGGISVPLIHFLKKEHQDLIHTGVVGGGIGRDPIGYAIAVDIVATEDELIRLGADCSHDGYYLLADYCNRCNPPLDQKTLDKLWNRAHQHPYPTPAANYRDSDTIKKRLHWWRWFNDPDYKEKAIAQWKKENPHRQWVEPDLQAYQEYLAWEAARDAEGEIPHDSPEYILIDEASDPKELWKINKHDFQNIQREQHLQLEQERRRFTAIKSPMKSGKTFALSNRLKDPNLSLLIIANTVALAENMAERYGCVCYNSPKVEKEGLEAQKRLAITSESLWKVPTAGKKFDVVVVDEVDQVIGSMYTSSTTKKKRLEITNNFQYFVLNSKEFYVADADLSSLVLGFCEHLCGQKAHVIFNTHIPHTGRAFYNFKDPAAHFQYVCDCLENGERVLIVTDSKKSVKKMGADLGGIDKFVEGIENLSEEEVCAQLEARFPDKKGMAVHGDNSAKPEVRKFIKRINKKLRKRKLHYLAVNSSLQSGVSIEYPAFDKVCCLFTGYTLTHTELGQLCHRYRPVVEISYSFGKVPNRQLETNAHVIERNLLFNNQEELQALGIDPRTGVPHPEVLKFVSALKARRNWSLNNIQANFERHIENMGYIIEPHPAEEEIRAIKAVAERMKEHAGVVNAAEVATILKSQDLTKTEYSGLSQQGTTDFFERCSLIKYDIQSFTGLEVTEELVTSWLKNNIPQKLTRLDYLFNNEKIARRSDLANRYKHFFLHDHTFHLLERQLLELVNFQDYLNPHHIYSNKNLEPLNAAVKPLAYKFKRLFNLTIYQAPGYLKEAWGNAKKAMEALYRPINTLQTKWLLSELASNDLEIPEDLSSRPEVVGYYQGLSPVLRLTMETRTIGKQFNTREMSPSQVHGALCNLVGLKRKMVKQTRAGRTYKIDPDSWAFAQKVLTHRQQQREERQQAWAEKIAAEAKRFDRFTSDQIQKTIEKEIRDAACDEPELVFLNEEENNSPNQDSQNPSHPPTVFNKNQNSGGGVTNPKVTLWAEVLIAHLGREANDTESTPSQKTPNSKKTHPKVRIEQMATGRDDCYDYYNYLKVKPEKGESFWVPIEWCTSLEGFPIRRNPDFYNPDAIPRSSLRTWRNWLLSVADENALSQFEKVRTPRELKKIAAYLSDIDLLCIEKNLKHLKTWPEWLPIPSEYQVDVDDVCGMLRESVEKGLEMLKLIMV